MTAEQQFQTRRRIFFLIEDTVIIAPEGYPRSHMEYLLETRRISDVFDRRFEDIVRGYYLDHRLVAYKGRDFEHWGVAPALSRHMRKLRTLMCLPDEALVYMGARRAEVGDIWVGKYEIGTIEEIIAHATVAG